MPYSFLYDLSRIPRNILHGLVEKTYKKKIHKELGKKAKMLVKTFRIDEATGLNVTDAITLIEDYVDVQTANVVYRKQFEKAKKKALLLPHCARKFMDSLCQSEFKAEIPSYECQSCKEDCLINKATQLGRKKGYDVYVIPGGSCVREILSRGYDGVVGVSCGMELQLGMQLIERMGIPGQGLFLTNNGCANTTFNLEKLEQIL